MNPLPHELAQAQIAGLHRQAEQARIACRARHARSTSRRDAATARRSAVLPRVRALLTGRAAQSAN